MAHHPDPAEVSLTRAARIAIRGVVQGVGFRPFVYRLAHEHGIVGWVRNTSWGVEMEVEASVAALDRFLRGLREGAPPLARIESLTVEDIPLDGYERFEILHSEPQAGAYQLISPDIATCDDCRREIANPADRRYRYPFTNCTNCGPRFTIIEDVPYDRPRTTMRAFPLCPACQREYDDPLDRRFHAQPNACPVCGPHVTLQDGTGRVLAERDDALRRAAELLRQGQIVAIKGLGGYQLACDATNREAVARLRERKRRPHKPFAVMVADLGQAEAHAEIGPEERELLTSSAAPIVLLPWREDSAIAREVGPTSLGGRLATLGLMLPYTPLHHILMGDVGRPLVMTSGNLSEEPIARDNDEALRRLARIADYYLTHNRGIYARYDDSVWFAPSGGPQPVRRARGYAPFPVRLPLATRPILACGPALKNTFCLTRDHYAFLSQHIGDMENVETFEHYVAAIELYRRLFHVEPEVVAVDLHPDYQSTRYGLEYAGERQVVRVPHHHAHLAACLADAAASAADAGLPGDGAISPAIGAILDGTGYGLDGRIWGGEFLVGDGSGFLRGAHLEYLPLPGGEGAIRHPYRLAVAYLDALLAPDTPLPPTLSQVSPEERRTLQRMAERGLNTPLTSSAGRLFDAVSALLGVCGVTSYEAQAAIELEMAAGGLRGSVEPYPFVLEQGGDALRWGSAPVSLSQSGIVRLRPLFEALLADMAQGVSVRQMARRFHRTVAEMIVCVSAWLRDQTGLDRVALSGGCFQNRLLLEMTLPLLRQAGLSAVIHRQVPANDGGVALGQAVVAHYGAQAAG